MAMLISAIGQGLIWAAVGIGLYLTFRILNFPDMTVEGTFPLGAATAVVLISSGMNPYLATICAMAAGAVAGMITGLLYTKGQVPILLAGILTMTAAYSINLRILGQANRSLLQMPTVFSSDLLQKLPTNYPVIVIGVLIVVIVIIGLSAFLKTQLGQAFVATGDNATMARSMGINTDAMTILGLMLANGLIALGGALVAQNNGFADVNMGMGIIVVGLASIIIGEVLFGGELTLMERLITVAIGSILYRFVLVLVLYIGFNADDLKLVSAIILGLALMIPKFGKRLNIKGRKEA